MKDITCPKGTKGGGPPSVPILLLLCFDKLCEKSKSQNRNLHKKYIYNIYNAPGIILAHSYGNKKKKLSIHYFKLYKTFYS